MSRNNVNPSTKFVDTDGFMLTDIDTDESLMLIPCDTAGNFSWTGVTRAPLSRNALQTSSTNNQYSDIEKPWISIPQEDWTGGRGNNTLSKDTTRYYDGKRCQAAFNEVIYCAPLDYYSDGFRGALTNCPNSLSWKTLTGSEKYIITQITGASLSAGEIYIHLRRRGTPPSSLVVQLLNNSKEVIRDYAYTTDEITDTLAEFKKFTFDSVTMSGTYYLAVYSSKANSENYWQVGVSTKKIKGQDTRVGANAGSVKPVPYDLLYRISQVQGNYQAKFFSYNQLQFMVRERPGYASAVWMNGDIGKTTGATSTTITDSSKNWSSNKWQGAKIGLTFGSGSHGPVSVWRTITANTSNSITVDQAWDYTPSGATYIIVDTPHWQQIYTLPTAVTDIHVVRDVVYFALGDYTDIVKMRWYNGSFEWRTITGEKASFLQSVRDSNGMMIYRGRNNGINGRRTVERARLLDWDATAKNWTKITNAVTTQEPLNKEVEKTVITEIVEPELEIQKTTQSVYGKEEQSAQGSGTVAPSGNGYTLTDTQTETTVGDATIVSRILEASNKTTESPFTNDVNSIPQRGKDVTNVVIVVTRNNGKKYVGFVSGRLTVEKDNRDDDSDPETPPVEVLESMTLKTPDQNGTIIVWDTVRTSGQQVGDQVITSSTISPTTTNVTGAPLVMLNVDGTTTTLNVNQIREVKAVGTDKEVLTKISDLRAAVQPKVTTTTTTTAVTINGVTTESSVTESVDSSTTVTVANGEKTTTTTDVITQSYVNEPEPPLRTCIVTEAIDFSSPDYDARKYVIDIDNFTSENYTGQCVITLQESEDNEAFHNVQSVVCTSSGVWYIYAKCLYRYRRFIITAVGTNCTVNNIKIGTNDSLRFEDPIFLLDNYGKITRLFEYGAESFKSLWIFQEGMVSSVNKTSDTTDTYTLDRINIDELQVTAEEWNGKAVATADVYLAWSWLNGMQRYYNTQLEGKGPDHDEGLPFNRQGRVSQIISYPANIFIAIDGEDGYSCVMQFNQSGWHELYRAPNAGERIFDMSFQPIYGSRPDRLWMCVGDDIVWLAMPSKVLYAIQDQYAEYTHESVMVSAWVTAGMADVEKLWQSLKIMADYLDGKNCLIEADYQIDEEEAWHPFKLMYSESPSQKQTFSDDHSVNGKKMRYRLRLQTTDIHKTPKVNVVVIEAVGRVDIKQSYTFYFRNIKYKRDLNGGFRDIEPLEVQNLLDEWANKLKKLRLNSRWLIYDDKIVYLDAVQTSVLNEVSEGYIAQISLNEL